MTKLLLRTISVLQIVGGVFGLGYTAWGYPRGSIAIIPLVVIGINLLSLYAGVALWRGRSFGRTASIIVQAMQLPKIISPAIVFMISFGFDLWVYFVKAELLTLGFEFRFLAFNQFYVNAEGAPLGFGISLVSCVFLAILLRYKPRVSLPESGHPALAAEQNQHCLLYTSDAADE